MKGAKFKFCRRKERTRGKISRLSDRVRLSIFKSGRHIYAQIIDDKKSITIASASTLERNIKLDKKSNCNILCASRVGELIAERAVVKGIDKVVFDKGGYKYHGVVKALADEARKKLKF